MRVLSWIVLIVEAIVAIVAAVVLFMIFSPSVSVAPTLALTGAVEGIILLALGNFALAIVALLALRDNRDLQAAAHSIRPPQEPPPPPEFSRA